MRLDHPAPGGSFCGYEPRHLSEPAKAVMEGFLFGPPVTDLRLVRTSRGKTLGSGTISLIDWLKSLVETHKSLLLALWLPMRYGTSLVSVWLVPLGIW